VLIARPSTQTPAIHQETTMSQTKRLLALLLLALSLGSLTACNTMAGVGEDIEEAGDSIEDTAEDCEDGDC
jgi:predicted small secreted protein